METAVLPYMVERGISVTGSFLDEQNEDSYVWNCRFDNERDRERSYAAVYETPRWTGEIGPRVHELLDVDHRGDSGDPHDRVGTALTRGRDPRPLRTTPSTAGRAGLSERTFT